VPENTTTQDAPQSGGAPTWMLTYGDTVTLLLTFFVLLLTFSTPTEDDFQEFVRGLMVGSQSMSLFQGRPGAGGVTPQERRLEESRLDLAGAEKPPMSDQKPMEELTKYHSNVDIAQLPELKGAVVIRVPLDSLFDDEGRLTAEGRRVLAYVVEMTRARSYSIIVRARAGPGEDGAEGEEQSITMAADVAQHLRQRAAESCRDIGLSDDIDLVEPSVFEGQCEIVMLEV